MTSEHAAGDYFQEFRVLSAPSTPPVSSNTISIISRLDKKTGERIVLWKEIQKVVKNADHVWNGTKAVPFMMDDDFEE